MKSYTEFLAAGVPVKLGIGGRLLYIQRSTGGAVIDVTFHNGANSQGVARVGKGFKAAPVNGFDQITFRAEQDTTVDFIVTDGEVLAQFDDANTIIGNDDGQAVPIRVEAGKRLAVDIGGGSVTVTADNVGISNTEANPVPVKIGGSTDGSPVVVRNQALATIVDHAAATINSGAAQLLVNDPTFKRLRIKNASASATVAIGGASVSLANAAIVLLPGEMWIEDDAAGAAWYAASDVNGANVRVMGVKV